ncbi:cupin domain-containing protein [Methanoplanus sp. FWC-SCC4]|uniref:Cupin domain-containing protein n=1 Tax=Methanochimaera problematica TaxID=2609417 RepID=A0AA97I327_9EURY|nr:cupin domain-containing protein [Methanoplanus sp. FWC-SCC4]WOF15446.1 cupin domain-containing protein [Methanoplanus sp. FWC-SCC4]
MKITNTLDIPVHKNPHDVDARKIYETKDATAVVITLQPGESLKKHKTPVDVFFYVLEGEGVVEIGNERETAVKDTVIESPANIPHRWFNDSPEPFRVLVVKVPSPVSQTKLL